MRLPSKVSLKVVSAGSLEATGSCLGSLAAPVQAISEGDVPGLDLVIN